MKLKANLVKRLREEKGQAFLAVLALLMIGSLTLPPVLSNIGTSLKTGRIYDDKTDELYAADSGIEDAMWQIKYDRLEVLLSDPDYDIYDFSTNWSYNIAEPINDLTVNVTIQNVWIPKNVTPLSPSQGRAIIEANKLMVAGTATDESNYKIKINFYPGEGEEEALEVTSLGIWLPLGFHYDGSCSLEVDIGTDNYTESVTDHAGGEAVIWEFSPAVPFTCFGANPTEIPMTAEVTFEYTADEAGARPATVSWMETSGVGDVPLSWDIDTRIYRIVSVAGGTEVEAYSSKCELRKMGAAIAGDYVAIGNSLMVDGGGSSYTRDQWLEFSSTEVDNIPNDPEQDVADVVNSYLYWSAWREESSKQTEFYDSCYNFGNWISGGCWDVDNGHFHSHQSSAEEDARYLTLKDQYSLDLSAYADAGAVTVSWYQWETGHLEPGDGLDFAFSADGGDNWSSNIEAFRNDIGSSAKYFDFIIPEQYLTDDFELRFYLVGFADDDDEDCYLDNIKVSAMVPDNTAVFKIDGIQVCFDEGEPVQGTDDIVASKIQVLPNYNGNGTPNGFSYSCFLDVTKLVQEFAEVIEEGDHHTGNADYTVGHVTGDTGNQWSYACWSLIVIYSSPETAGHQLYLWDDFLYANNDTNIDFDGDGEDGGDITGFVIPEQISGIPNAAKLTCFVGEGDEPWMNDYLEFTGQSGASQDLSNTASPSYNVWNSASPGIAYDGVDIDTFDVPWKNDFNENLVEPGDTSAHLELPTGDDSWNLIYIILSMYSETVTGGTTHYVIHWS